MKRSRKYLTAALLAAVVLAGISFASAGSLALSGGSISVVAAAHPCPGTATAEPALSQGGGIYRGVALTLPPGCADRYVQLTVIRPGTDRAGDGTTDANGQVTMDFGWWGTYDEDDDNDLVATVAGWDLPTEWWVDPSPYIWCTVVSGGAPGATCTATVTLFNGNKPGGGNHDYYDVVVTTTSTTPVRWEVGFDLDHSFYGDPPETLGNSTLDDYYDGGTNWSGTQANVTRQSACSTYPELLTVRGRDNSIGGNNFRDVVAGRRRAFSLVLDYPTGTYDDVVDANCS